MPPYTSTFWRFSPEIPAKRIPAYWVEKLNRVRDSDVEIKPYFPTKSLQILLHIAESTTWGCTDISEVNPMPLRMAKSKICSEVTPSTFWKARSEKFSRMRLRFLQFCLVFGRLVTRKVVT
jgi:hypothetical protein